MEGDIEKYHLPTAKENHIRDFLSKAEPRSASHLKTSELSGKDLRRVFFGFFGVPPGRKPDKNLN